MKIILGNATNIELAKEIIEKFHIQSSDIKTSRFADGEINVEIDNDLSQQEVIIIHSISPPVNDNLMALLLTVDAVKRIGAKKIIVIIPYYGYSRQDRIIKADKTSSALSARLIANLLETSGINEIVTIDIHSSQIEGFFNIPITNLNCFEVFISSIQKKNLAIVAPDVGAITRARTFASMLETSHNMDLKKIVVIDKHREKAGISEVVNILGQVENKDCVIIDDIVDSGGTLCNAAQSLKEEGAQSVTACITHGVLSGNAIEKILDSSFLDRLIITNTIPLQFVKNDKISIISIADILINFILRRYNAN